MIDNKQAVLNKILAGKYLRAVYQPIVSLKDGTIHAYEALSRVTLTEDSVNIGELFVLAEKYGCLWELEKQCRTNALKYAVDKPKGAKLFINIDGNVLRDDTFQKGFTREKLNKYSVDINDVVLEITERSDFDDRELMESILSHYRQQGYRLALDDLGSGYSGLNRLHTIKPSYVKIDYELVHGINNDKAKKSLVRMLVRHCNDMDYKLIAEGIENEEELKCLINIGVDYGQGFYLKRPDADFGKLDKAVVKKILDYQKKKSENKHSIGNVGKMGIVLFPTCTIGHAKNIFKCNNQLLHVSIVDRECKFYGLISREQVMVFSDGDNNKVESIMNTDIVQIDADKSIKNAIGKLMVREEHNFYYPFVILKKNRYYGIATLRDLIIEIGKEM